MLGSHSQTPKLQQFDVRLKNLTFRFMEARTSKKEEDCKGLNPNSLQENSMNHNPIKNQSFQELELANPQYCA